MKGNCRHQTNSIGLKRNLIDLPIDAHVSVCTNYATHNKQIDG